MGACHTSLLTSVSLQFKNKVSHSQSESDLCCSSKWNCHQERTSALELLVLVVNLLNLILAINIDWPSLTPSLHPVKFLAVLSTPLAKKDCQKEISPALLLRANLDAVYLVTPMSGKNSTCSFPYIKHSLKE